MPNLTLKKKKINFPSTQDVFIFSLENKNGIQVEISNYGGLIKSIFMPDKKGNIGDIVLGFDDLTQYMHNEHYLGVIVGRYANRIRNGLFTLDQKEYQLAQNLNQHHIHGGINGFDQRIWKAKTIQEKNLVGVELTLLSCDLEEGYPGNLAVRVKYTLNNLNELKLEYYGETDKETPVNLTNHTYFNLGGIHSKDILTHHIQIHSESITKIDQSILPTGKMMPVKNTPFEFNILTPLKERLDSMHHEQMQIANGYDHNFVLNKEKNELVKAANIAHPESGRAVEIFTTKPGIQFYTGNFLKGLKGKSNKEYGAFAGLCLETQHFPDSPNISHFPSPFIGPGKPYESTTIYKFKLVE